MIAAEKRKKPEDEKIIQKQEREKKADTEKERETERFIKRSEKQ